MSDDAAPPPVVTATVTPMPIPESFDIPGAVMLARDLAVGMYDEAILLKKHEVTPGQYATLKTMPYFQKLVEQAALAWNAPRSSQERLAEQAAVGLEGVLPDVIARAKVRNEPLQAVAQLVKVLGDLCGANDKARQVAPIGEKFKITINLGADTEVYNKTKPVITVVPAEEVPSEVSTITRGFGDLLTLQTEPEKA